MATPTLSRHESLCFSPVPLGASRRGTHATVKDGTFVLFDAHHDGYFHSATDDTVGCATNLAIAKAMMMSGYKPKHTVRFMFVTGEEFGYTNCYNDWCIGAWWAATHGHPEWIGKIRGFINNDQTQGAGRFNMTANPEFRPYLNAQGTASGSLFGTRGWRVATTPNSTWNDSFTFTAAGAPCVTVSSGGKVPQSNGVYHTQYMTIDLNDFTGLAQDAKFIGRLAQGLDGGLLPYSFTARATELAGKVDASALTLAGADAGAVTRLQNDIVAFQAAAAAFDGRAGSIPASHYPSTNAAVLRIHKELGITFTGQDVWQVAIYPHEQVFADVQRLETAIAALKLTTPDTATALTALSNVAWSGVGLRLSQPVYLHLITRLDPNYYRAAWGAQGHTLELASLLNIVPQYEAIQAGTWDSTTVAQLNAMLQHDLGDLNDRLNAMSDTLEQVIPQINALPHRESHCRDAHARTR